jgi:hypothetical protein
LDRPDGIAKLDLFAPGLSGITSLWHDPDLLSVRSFRSVQSGGAATALTRDEYIAIAQQAALRNASHD